MDSLRARWHALTGQPAPATFRAPLLRAAVSYKLQERALGGLRTSTVRLLQRVVDAADPARNGGPARLPTSGPVPQAPRRSPAPPLRIKPGTRPLRTWQGSTHEVLVGEATVFYRGRTYRSLSEVARETTGQCWSGPLFFGLKQRAAASTGSP